MSDKPGVSSVSSVGFRLSRSGRFSGETDPLMEQFNASIGYDKRMWRQDGEGSFPVIPCQQSLPGTCPRARTRANGGIGRPPPRSNRRGAPPLLAACPSASASVDADVAASPFCHDDPCLAAEYDF
jgi:hypothetical protein